VCNRLDEATRERQAFEALAAAKDASQVAGLVVVALPLDATDNKRLNYLERRAVRKSSVVPTLPKNASDKPSPTRTPGASVRVATFSRRTLKLERGIFTLETVMRQNFVANCSSVPTNAQYLSRQDKKAIARRMAQCVAACHSAGISHHDVKPENFMFFPLDGAPAQDRLEWLKMPFAEVWRLTTLKITDLGYSMPGNAPCECARGTPSYASPQTLTGRPHLPFANDVFSLGVVFYELLGDGRLPFEVVHSEEPAPAPDLDLEYLQGGVHHHYVVLVTRRESALYLWDSEGEQLSFNLMLLMRSMLECAQDMRPSVEIVAEHPALAGESVSH
jgi:serine/threonine protein kinase